MPPPNLHDAQLIRDLIVDPVVEGVERKLVDRLDGHDAKIREMRSDIDALRVELDAERGFRAKIAVVYGFVAVIVGGVWGQFKPYVLALFSASRGGGGGH